MGFRSLLSRIISKISGGAAKKRGRKKPVDYIRLFEGWLKPTKTPSTRNISKQGGHRGIAVGLGKKPVKLPSGRVLNRQTISDDEVEAFVYDQELLFVHSSNVGAVQYFPEVEKMMVEFLGSGMKGKSGGKTSAYLYSNVTIDEAISLAQAQSKGIWIWDNFRVRGSKTAHKKPYIKLR